MITEAAAGHPKAGHLVYMSALFPYGTSALHSEFTNPDDMRAFDLTFGGRRVRPALGLTMLKLMRGRANAMTIPIVVGRTSCHGA